VANHRTKELETAFKKYYSVISQAVVTWQSDNGTPLTPTTMTTSDIVNGFSKYFRTDCMTYTACLPNGGLNGVGYQTYIGRTGTTTLMNEGIFGTVDGVIFFTDDGNLGGSMDGWLFISVDVNGRRKPNKFGHDVFLFEVLADGRLHPGGAEGTYLQNSSVYCSETSTNGYNGLGCAYKAFTDENYWKNLP
jgi:hypothetical protein